nr:methyltransferase domain-containing protein [Desulfobacterales bacterium]
MRRYIYEKRYYEEAWISNARVILRQITYDGLRRKGLTEDDLVRYDQIDHVGGIRNTQMLADKLRFEPGMNVLDVGGGMGGAARFLAHKYGCRVKVLDLIPERCVGGMELTRMTGLDHLVSFQAADAQCIPFKNEVFDVVWSQDCFDSIADKGLLFRECYRVLKPGGQLIFTDHLKGQNKPVPDGIYLWPDDIDKITFEDYERLLEGCGFRLDESIDLTYWAISVIYRVKTAILDGRGSLILEAQGSEYYKKLVSFINSFLGYLQGGMVQYGAFQATRV